MTEIDCATSSSSASMTGAVAAIAEPPQIEEPTPMSVEIFREHEGFYVIPRQQQGCCDRCKNDWKRLFSCLQDDREIHSKTK